MHGAHAADGEEGAASAVGGEGCCCRWRSQAPPHTHTNTSVQEFDGASKSNPGPSGFGAVLYDDATGEEVRGVCVPAASGRAHNPSTRSRCRTPPLHPPPQVLRLCRYMGDRHTNNQAEYGGLIAGLQVGGWVGGMTRDVPRALPPLNSTRHTCTPPPPTTTLSQAALDLGCRDIKVQGDSKLVVEQASVCVGGRGGIVQGTRLRPR